MAHRALLRYWNRSNGRTGVLIGAVLLLAGCGGATGSEPATRRASGTTATAAQGDYAGLVDIGGGRTIHLECRGRGAPTVVFISGRSNSAAIWETLENPTDPGPAVLAGT